MPHLINKAIIVKQNTVLLAGCFCFTMNRTQTAGTIIQASSKPQKHPQANNDTNRLS